MTDYPGDPQSPYENSQLQLPAAGMAQTPAQSPVTTETPKQPGGRGFWRLLGASLLGAALALGGVFGFQNLAGTNEPSSSTVAEATATSAPGALAVNQAGSDSIAATSSSDLLTNQDIDPVAVGEKVIPSIVTVQIGSDIQGEFAEVGSGSGVIVDSSGLIVTNNHVASSGDQMRVVLSDGRTYDATLIGTDPVTDLALISIPATNLTPIEFGSSDALQVGSPAIAVGNPLGLRGGPSLTVGVISAFNRIVQTSSTTTLYGMIQADAPITSGSSGGALVDADGRLVGITTAVGVSQVGVEGIGFATPVEIVKRVVADLQDDGQASNGLLGITGTTGMAPTNDGGEAPVGVEIESVSPGSGAAAAGLQVGDMIKAINGQSLDTMEELVGALRRTSAGDQVSITIERGGATQELQVTLTELQPTG